MNEKPAKTQATYVSHFIYTYSYYRRRYITVSVSTYYTASVWICVRFHSLSFSFYVYIFIALHSMRSLSGALFGHLSRATRFSVFIQKRLQCITVINCVMCVYVPECVLQRGIYTAVHARWFMWRSFQLQPVGNGTNESDRERMTLW